MNQTVHTINLHAHHGRPPRSRCSPTPPAWPTNASRSRTPRSRCSGSPSGALGIIHGTTAAYPGLDARLSVYGTKGSAVVSDDQLVYLHETVGAATEIGMSSMTGGNQVTAAHQIGSDELSFGHAHRLQLADFIAAVTTGGTPRVSTSDARTSLAVILALYESAATGLPVRL